MDGESLLKVWKRFELSSFSASPQREFLVICFLVSDKIQVGETFMLAPVSRGEQGRQLVVLRGDFYGVHLDFTRMPPNTSLEPTPITPVCLRCGFPAGGSHGRRGSVLGR